MSGKKGSLVQLVRSARIPPRSEPQVEAAPPNNVFYVDPALLVDVHLGRFKLNPEALIYLQLAVISELKRYHGSGVVPRFAEAHGMERTNAYRLFHRLDIPKQYYRSRR